MVDRTPPGEWWACLWGGLLLVVGAMFFVPLFLFNLLKRMRGPNRIRLMREATDAHHEAVRMGGVT